jgi:hypothetical protein
LNRFRRLRAQTREPEAICPHAEIRKEKPEVQT